MLHCLLYREDLTISRSNAQPTTPSKSSAHLWKKEFAHPRFWLTWLGLGLLRITVYLPAQWRKHIARTFGLTLYRLASRRRHITETNIKLCFPELTLQEQDQLVKQVFIENMLGLLETGLPLWGNREKLRSKVSFDGMETLEAAYAQGKGVILVGAHYSSLDLGGFLFSLFSPVDVLYRPHKNLLFNHFLVHSRRQFCNEVIPKNDMRAIIRCLKQGSVFWYPADQDYGAKHSVFAPFFGVNAATINVTSRLAKVNASPTLIFSCHRTSDNRYHIRVTPPLDNMPSGNDVADATQVNRGLEAEIRRYPAQYMWVHRRFKTRPNGEPYLY